MNEQPASIRDWLIQQSAGDIPLHRIARALGVSHQKAGELLNAAPTAETLLNLNRLAQVRHLALANRVWPNCPWLAWETKRSQPYPTFDLILRVFGLSLLDYVDRSFGKETVLQYWRALEVPDAYDDLPLDDEMDDPLDGIPEEGTPELKDTVGELD